MRLTKARPLTPDDLRTLWTSLGSADQEAARADAMFWACEWDANWFDDAAMHRMAAACLDAADNWVWRNAGPEGAWRVAAAFVSRADVLATWPSGPSPSPAAGRRRSDHEPSDGHWRPAEGD